MRETHIPVSIELMQEIRRLMRCIGAMPSGEWDRVREVRKELDLMLAPGKPAA